MPARLTQDEFISKCRTIHGDKYDYSKAIYKNKNTKLTIICKKHGSFQQTPGDHIHKKTNCSKCANKVPLTNEEFISRANIIHNNKYDYSLSDYITSIKKIKIICPIHGLFRQSPTSHTKSGCPYCTNHAVHFLNCLATTHPELAKQWHPTSNNNLTPFDLTYGSGVKVYWICSKNHTWNATLSDRTVKNAGCPTCSESKGEQAISVVLDGFKILYRRQFKFDTCKYKRHLPFDFMIKVGDKPKLIECHGEQHYRPVGFGSSKSKALSQFELITIRDDIKRNWCLKNSVRLLEIPYWEFANIKEIVKNFIAT